VWITAVRVFEQVGEMRSGLALYEITRGACTPNESTPHRGVFTQIDTDEVLSGLVPGGSSQVKALGQTLIGEDPRAIEAIWDRLYTSAYSRWSVFPALSILDLCLWDLNGKLRDEPVYQLLGGPCQDRIPAYAAMLGFDTRPELAGERSAEWISRGFSGLKWYLPENATRGHAGLRRNAETVRAVREAVGDDIDIMIDCILSGSSGNSLTYAIKLARVLEPYGLTWLEEPLNAEDMDAYRMLKEETSIPLAFGERMQGRWQFKQALDCGAASVLQPEPSIAGGLSEMRRIGALMSTYGVPMVPHANETGRIAVHFLFANPSRLCPMAEWGVRINHNTQHFFTDFYEPIDGYFCPPAGPGFGYALDQAKIKERREL